MRARFDRIFQRSTGFATLDRLPKRPHANKAELLMVLDHPKIPMHTSGSENDIRCQVIRRAVSGATRGDTGRDCRDAFLGLGKTCRMLGVAFCDYRGARIDVAGAPNFQPRAYEGGDLAARTRLDHGLSSGPPHQRDLAMPRDQKDAPDLGTRSGSVTPR